MRFEIAIVGALGMITAEAAAQTIPTDLANALRLYQYDDGTAETSYKLGVPAAPLEAFSVDFDDDARGKILMGVQISTYASSPGALGIGSISICRDNLALDPFGHTPDLSSPLTSLTKPTGQPGFTSAFCTGATATTYDLPDVTLPTTGIHAVMSFVSGDSATWLCTDSGTARGHSYWTTDGFSSPANPFNANWLIRLATPHYSPNGGEFLIDGLTDTTARGQSPISLQFWSRDTTSPTTYLDLVVVGGALVPTPGVVLQTGMTNFTPNGIPSLGELFGFVPCWANSSLNGLTMKAFFADNLDLKRDGHKRVKLTNGAFANLADSTACCPQLCFGIADDGVMDGTAWKVQAVSGSKDWFNTRFGTLPIPGGPYCPGVVNNLTGVEAVSWDFCGTGPCWAEVGIYPSNLLLDPTGGTPDVSAPLTSIGGASACMPPGSMGWGFPAVFYDTPDILADTVTDYHVAMKWASQDSCTWMGGDSNSTDDDRGSDCAGPLPSHTSFFTQDGYATNAVPMSFVNWQERIDWN